MASSTRVAPQNASSSWPPFKSVVELFECSQPAIEDYFGVAYLIFKDASSLLEDQVLETCGELHDVMSRRQSWFVRPRETGCGFFHFIGNDVFRTRQLDLHFDLGMDDLLAVTPQEVHALRMFASDVNRCEGREAFMVFYDPSGFEFGGRRALYRVLRSRSREWKHACSTCKGLGECVKLDDACNHCGRRLPCSNLTDACNHCKCLQGPCRDNSRGPYTLHYCRHCSQCSSSNCERSSLSWDYSSDDSPLAPESMDKRSASSSRGDYSSDDWSLGQDSMDKRLASDASPSPGDYSSDDWPLGQDSMNKRLASDASPSPGDNSSDDWPLAEESTDKRLASDASSSPGEARILELL